MVPDFDTGDVLYLTASTSILVGPEASSLIARTNLAVKVTVTATRYVRAGLPFRGSVIDSSPYNPPIRHLLSEQAPHVSSQQGSDLTATLIDREQLTPNISRFTFDLPASKKDVRWAAGQHITLDFAQELDNGYAHMRDDDPQSLNDDFVRTFTVSNTPNDDRRVEITARKHGPATGLLWRHNMRVRLELPVMGFGGEEAFQMSGARQSVFVAGGVGITPVLAQAGGLVADGGSLKVLWSLRGEDLRLAVDSFERIEGLAGVTRLFVTGSMAEEGLERVRAMGSEVERRRMDGEDVVGG